MRVQMLTGLTGTHDGEDWPPAGAVADLPDALASDLIAAGHASAVEVPAAVEVAAVEPAENAAKPNPRRRRATTQE
jgi:hypothetical protein